MGRNPEKDFQVPGEALRQSPKPFNAPREDVAKDDAESVFAIPRRAIKDLGSVAGEVSSASELLDEVKPDNHEHLPVDYLEERASRNFSFEDGETSPFFKTLVPKLQRATLLTREKLIKKYGEQGVNERTLGILCVNMLDDGLFGSGTLQAPGGGSSLYQYFYLAHLGEPLETVEERQTVKIKRGMKVPVEDLYSTEAIDWVRLSKSTGSDWFYWANALPRPDENSFWPTVHLNWWRYMK